MYHFRENRRLDWNAYRHAWRTIGTYGEANLTRRILHWLLIQTRPGKGDDSKLYARTHVCALEYYIINTLLPFRLAKARR